MFARACAISAQPLAGMDIKIDMSDAAVPDSSEAMYGDAPWFYDMGTDAWRSGQAIP